MTSRWTSMHAAITLVLLGARGLWAQDTADPHDAQPERPTVATHAGTVAPGYLEIETGLQFDRLAGKNAGTTLPAVFKTGVTANQQLEVTAFVLDQPQQSTGVGDLTLSYKWRFADRSPIGDVAIQPSVKLPTGSTSSGTGTGTTDASLLLISSTPIGPAQMDLNLGWTHRSGDGTAVPKDATLWTASFGGPAVDPFGWVLEFFGYPKTSGPAGQPGTSAMLLGPTWTARKWLVFDAGLIVPMSGWLPHSTYVGLTWNAGRL